MMPVILLAHGSPDPRASLAARSLAERLDQSFGTTVIAAFLQDDPQTLTVASRRIATSGRHRAVVVPTLLSDAFHARVDVPAALSAARAATGLALHSTAPIGPDPALLAAMDRELPPGPRLLAAAGTADIGAQQHLQELADHWTTVTGHPTEVAFAAQAEPSIQAALAQLEAQTGRRASIGRFVLFPGVLPDRIAAAAGDRIVSSPLADSPELHRLIEHRVHQALRKVA